MNKEEKQLIIAYKEVFNSEHGKLILKDLSKLSHLLRARVPLDIQGRIDPLEVMRNEGQRSVLVHIYTKLNKNPNEPIQERAITEISNE